MNSKSKNSATKDKEENLTDIQKNKMVEEKDQKNKKKFRSNK